MSSTKACQLLANYTETKYLSEHPLVNKYVSFGDNGKAAWRISAVVIEPNTNKALTAFIDLVGSHKYAHVPYSLLRPLTDQAVTDMLIISSPKSRSALEIMAQSLTIETIDNQSE